MTDALDDALTSTPEQTLARWLLGTRDPADVRARLTTFVEGHLGASPAEIFLCGLSVGAVFGMALDDGRRIVVKVLRPDMEPHRAAACRRVQTELHAAGFPCPEPLLPATSFGPNAIAFVDAFVAGGGVGDGHDPAIRRAGAFALARLARLAAAVPDTQALTVQGPLPGDDLWPTPHNPLFDFGATAGGAEWIDELATRARARADRVGDVVVIHTDWTVRNLRFVDTTLHTVFDWDSVGRELEVRVVGTAAAMFPAHGLREGMSPPGPDDAAAFVADFEDGRGRRFTAAEHRAIGAAALYGMAYTARCEHAVDPAGELFDGSYRQRLATERGAYLEL